MPYSHWRNRSVMILSLAGFAVTAYLTLAHLNKLPLSCESTLFDCGKVAQHPLAHGLGIPALHAIPTAAFGLAFFVAMLALCAIRPLTGATLLGRVAGGVQLTLTAVGLCVFALLTYAEMFIIHAWCPWCIIAALLTLGIMVILPAKRSAGTSAPAGDGSTDNSTTLPLPALRRRTGEMFFVVGMEVVGIAVSAVLLWYVKYHTVPPPQIAPDMTAARLQLTECRTLGNNGVPYTLVEFGNYRCPHCKAAIPEVDTLLRQYAGKLQVVFSPATRQPDEQFYIQCCAAEAAARQGKFTAMHQALFAQQDALTNMRNPAMRARIIEIARTLDIDIAAFTRDLDDRAVYQRIQHREQLATQNRLFPLPLYIFLTPSHPPVVLHNTAQMLQWLHDPAHW